MIGTFHTRDIMKGNESVVFGAIFELRVLASISVHHELTLGPIWTAGMDIIIVFTALVSYLPQYDNIPTSTSHGFTNYLSFLESANQQMIRYHV
jgi:hypothetical protein